MNEKVRKVLARAREILSEPKAWIKGAMAETADGDSVTPWFKEACRFCATGAIARAADELEGTGVIPRVDHCNTEGRATHELRRVLAKRAVERGASETDVVEQSVTRFNDAAGTEHEHVVALFDAALAR